MVCIVHEEEGEFVQADTADVMHNPWPPHSL